MGIFEIISAIVLIVACVFIVIVVLMSETKTGMSQAIGGASSDNFFQKNSGRTKEAKLNRAAVVATAVFFILALAVNIINVHFGGKETSSSSTGSTTSTSSTVSDIDTAEADGAVTVEASGADSGSSTTDSTTSTSSAADSTVSE